MSLEIISSKFQTKQWRMEQEWYTDGKRNECEKYQEKLIKNITNVELQKTQERMNIISFEIHSKSNPLKNIDGFEWTENFDYVQNLNEFKLYYNPKFITDSGGAQMRSLREVYHFVYYQLEHIQNNYTKKNNIFFINILDGNFCNKYYKNFQYLSNKYDKNFFELIYIGDMYNFSIWFKQRFNSNNMKKELGQFYTTNYNYILQNLELPENTTHIIEPFAGNGDILNFIENKEENKYEIECYDIEPKQSWITTRDTILNPPNYKSKFILTNPPYLARNKNDNKILYDKYNVNDIYKCFIKEIIFQKPIGGIIIIPLNFWSSIRKMDIKLRQCFLETFYVERVNIFEEKVFEDTTYSVCSMKFLLGQQKQNPIKFDIYPNSKKIEIIMDSKNNYTIGGEIYKFGLENNTYKVDRILKDSPQEFYTNILIKCIDDNENNKINAKIVDTKDIYIDTTKNKSSRSYMSLLIEPSIDINKQQKLVDNFNELLNKYRQKYNSLFLTNYRESNSIARKRISFELIYSIIKHLLLNL